MQGMILAAGRGKRLAPLTDNQPKVMVPIAGQPLVERISRQLVANGVAEQVVVVGYMKDMVMNHLGDGSAWGAKITYVDQGEPKGTGQAIRLGAEKLTDDFLMVYGDSLIETEMMARVLKASTPGAVGCAEVDDPSRYGILSLDDRGCVTGLVEKPQSNPPSNLAVLAMYKLPLAIRDALANIPLSPRGEYEINDGVLKLIAEGTAFTAVTIQGMDIATMADWERANEVVKRVA
ncbi:MAG: sugar phosphate nucleotidyltransferase [Bdellovibrionales bacterium]